MIAPRVTGLPSRASGGRIHVCPRRAYVGTKSRSVAFGVGVYRYARRHTCARSREPAGFLHDKRRWGINRFQFIYIRFFNYLIRPFDKHHMLISGWNEIKIVVIPMLYLFQYFGKSLNTIPTIIYKS
jgi:hypothetical protein